MGERINGIVLAGGKSSRLGRDKAGLAVRGETLLARTVRLARGYCAEVHVSGRDPSPLGVSAPWMEDDSPGFGPAGGILTGLRRLGGPLLVLACDLPLLDEATIERLLLARGRNGAQAATVYREAETGRIEPLVAVYEARAAGLLQAAIKRGEYALRRAVPEQERLHVPYARRHAAAFRNINSPADLEMIGVAASDGERRHAG